MKLLFALLFLLPICLCSCRKDTVDFYDQEHIDVTLEPDALYTVMNERDVLGVRDTAGIHGGTAAPVLYQSETKGYLLPNYPEDVLLAGREAADEYRLSDNAVNRIEVYATPDCAGEPEKVIELTGMKQKIRFQWLYADEETGHFTCTGTEETDRIGYFYEFSETGEMLRRIRIPNMDLWHLRMVHKCCLYGDIYYYMVPVGDTFNVDPIYLLYRMNFADGTKEKIAEYIVAGDFEGDSFYCLKRNSGDIHEIDGDLYRIDLKTGEGEALAEMNVIGDHATPIYTLTMDTENNLVYFATFMDAFAFDPETQSETHVIHSAGSHVNLIEIQDSTLYCEIGSGYFVYDLPEEPVPYTAGLTPLVFRGYYPSSGSQFGSGYNPYTYNNIFDLMKTNGYESCSEAVLIENEQEYAFTMAKKLMAGDTDFDLFYVNTEMAQLFDAQYYEDLARYSRLSRDYFDDMVPGLREICTIDGRLSLVPIGLNAQIMVIDNTLAEGGITFPRTVDDLVNLADTMTFTDGSYFMAGTRGATTLRKLFEEFAANYILSDLDDETALADLTHLYDTCVKLADSDKMYAGRGYRTQKSLITFGMNNGLDVMYRGDIQSGSLPKINETYKTPVSGEFWAINPNSEKKELAGAFLLCFLGNSRIKTYSGAGVYYMNDELPESTPEVMAIRELFRQQLTEGIRSYEAPDVFNYVDEHFKNIKNGDMTAEEAAQQLMRYLRMVKFE